MPSAAATRGSSSSFSFTAVAACSEACSRSADQKCWRRLTSNRRTQCGGQASMNVPMTAAAAGVRCARVPNVTASVRAANSRQPRSRRGKSNATDSWMV